MNVIEVQHLRKSFKNLNIIKDCSLSVKSNEIYGFLGINGAGKTTIFKMLCGLLKKDSGTINILGLDIEKNRNEILKNMGLSIDTPIFYEHLSAEENLKIHLAYMETKGDIKETLKQVGLDYIDDRPVSKFSLGMRARLAIARSLVHNPKILILDEPLNGLDPQGIRDMRLLFKKLCHSYKKNIILSSHTLSEVEHIADTIGILSNGVIAAQTNINDIKSKYSNLEDYYFKITEGVR